MKNTLIHGMVRSVTNLLVILSIVISGIGFTPAQIVFAEDANPYIFVNLQQDEIYSGGWLENSSINIKIYENASEPTPSFESSQETVPDPEVPTNFIVEFDLSSQFDIQSGNHIELSDGTTTFAYDVKSLRFSSINVQNDVITGFTDNNTEVTIEFFSTGHVYTVTSDPASGVWSIDLSGQEDILAGSTPYLFVDNRQTSTSQQIPNPQFTVWIDQDGVETGNWGLGSNITLKIDNPSTPENPDYQETRVFNDYTIFSLYEILDILPGFYITIEDDRYHILLEKVVTDIALTHIDLEPAQFSGTASLDDPIEISIFNEGGKLSHQTVSTGGSGNWSVTFPDITLQPGWAVDICQFPEGGSEADASCLEYWIPSLTVDTNTDVVSGNGWNHRATVTLGVDAYTDTQMVGNDGEVIFNLNGLFDIRSGQEISLTDGIITRILRVNYNPRLNYNVNTDVVEGYDWLLGSTLTLTIDDLDNGAGVDYSTTTVAGPAPWNSDEVGIILELNGAFDAEAGDVVTLSDGITTRELLLSNLTVTSTNVNNDTVSGTATPFSRVEVDFFPEGYHRTVDADVSGNWLADFSTPGDEENEQDTFDIPLGKDCAAMEADDDGDRTRYEYFAPYPFIIVTHNENYIEAVDFPYGATVFLTIDDPSNGEGVDFQTSKQTGSGEWADSWALFELTYDVKPGDLVQVTDGSTTKELVVASLEVTSVDPSTDTVSGTAEAGAELTVFATEYNKQVIADSSGDWIADFSDSFNIVPGTWGDVRQYDTDNDRSRWFWRVPIPNIQALKIENRIYTRFWPYGSNLTLTIDDPSNGSGVDLTLTKQLDPDQMDYLFNLDDSNFTISVGHIVNITDGTTTKQIVVRPVKITRVDVNNDLIRGTASPLEKIDVYVNSTENVYRYVTANASGIWEANFSIPDGQNIATDIKADSTGWAREVHSGDDGATYFTLAPTTISGKVDLPGEDDSGVVVTLVGSSLDPDPSAITAADGSYTISNIPLGDSGTLTPDSATFSFTPVSFSIPPFTSNLSGKDFIASLNQYTIQGFVYSGVTGLGGVQVAFADIYKATTSSNGSYTIINIPHGTTGTLTASKIGYSSEYTGVNTFPASITQNWSGQSFDADVQLCTINGTIKNLSTPIGGVLVTFNGYQAITSSSGVYTIQSIPCGTEGTLTATKTGHAITYTGLRSFPEAVNEDWNSEDFSAVTSYRISGSVLVGGSGVAGAAVLFDPEEEGLENITALTTSTGTYILDVPVNIAGTLSASFGATHFQYTATGTNQKTFPAQVNANWSGQNFGLSNYKMITGSVIFQGVGVGGVTIAFDEHNTTTSSNGKYTLFLPGNLTGTLSAAQPGYVFNYSATGTNVKVFPALLSSNWANQNFIGFSESFTLTGKVLLSSSPEKPLPGANLSFFTGGHTFHATSDEDGNYVLSGIPRNATGSLVVEMEGFLFEPSAQQIPEVTESVSADDFIALSPPQYPVPLSPQNDANGISTPFVWDGTETASSYNVMIEYDANGTWQLLSDAWYQGADACDDNLSCNSVPLSNLSSRYYRWKIRSNDQADTWSPYLYFQVKKTAYAPTGALEKPLGDTAPITFTWGPIQQVVNKVLTNAMQYRISLYFGSTVIYDAPATWFDAADVCLGEVCKITLDFNPDQLLYGSYSWKIQARSQYVTGDPPVTKTVLSKQATASTFALGPAPVEGLTTDDISAASVSAAALSVPVFSWAWSNDAYDYTLWIEKQDPYTGVWKQIKKVAFVADKPISKSNSTIYMCEDTSSPDPDGIPDVCRYSPGGTWAEGNYRWFVQARNFTKVGTKNNFGTSPVSMAMFTIGEPLTTPQPISPAGLNYKPASGNQVFRWEESPYAQTYILKIYASSRSTTISIDTTDQNLTCTAMICSYILDAAATPSEELDYGSYSYTVQAKKVVTVAGANKIVLSKASAKQAFTYGPPAPELSVIVTNRKPSFLWERNGANDPTQQYSLVVENYNSTKKKWVLYKKISGKLTNFTCDLDSTCEWEWNLPKYSAWSVGEYRINIQSSITTKAGGIGKGPISKWVSFDITTP